MASDIAPHVLRAISTTAPGYDCKTPRCDCYRYEETEEPVWGFNHSFELGNGDILWSGVSRFASDEHYGDVPPDRSAERLSYWEVEDAYGVDTRTERAVPSRVQTDRDKETVDA